MTVIDILEKRLVLGITRLICVALLCIALASLVVVVWASFAGGRTVPAVSDPVVGAQEILSSIAGSQEANDLSPDLNPSSLVAIPNATGLAIPAALESVLVNDSTSQPVLDSWLGKVPEQDRQQFLNELSNVVVEANRHAATWEWDNRQRYVATAMGRYAEVKIRRLDEITRLQTLAAAQNAQYHLDAGVLLAICAALILLLAVLTIERNTRPGAKVAGGK